MTDHGDYSAGQILLALIGMSRVKVFELEGFAWQSQRGVADLGQGLAERLESSRWALLGLGFRRFTHYGTVSGTFVTLFKLSEKRNSFEPKFRGEIRANGASSELVGTIGMDPIIRPFMTLWLGFIVFFVALALGGGAPPIFIIVPGVMFTFGCIMVKFAVRSCRRNATELGKWIGDQVRQIDES